MVSALILKVIICQKPLRFIFCQGPPAFLTNVSFLCKSSAPDFSLRFLCTKHSDFNPKMDRRWTDRKYGGQSFKPPNAIRLKAEELWDDVVQGSRMRNSSPKSVFAAGTAKRTREEMLRRKPPQVSQDQMDQPRKAGSNPLLTFLASSEA